MSSVILAGDTSGTITLQAPAVAGTSVLTLPITTDTLIGLATTDTLTNKTLTAPILTTPALGTPASGVMTNVTGTASGLTAGNVTTNANLTGVITSVGNATAVASQTGTGSTFVMQASPSLTTPALGTPSALVGTNITGTASGLTAGNVTTNANLTGMVTSVGNAATVVTNANLTGAITSIGNATSLGSFTSAQLSGALTDETGTGAAVFATSPTLVTPALGTPASGVVTNLTGTASININGTVGATTPAAGSFTTGTFSGLITSTVGNNAQVFGVASATTGYQYMLMANTGSSLRLAIESSVGGTLSSGTTAYASIFGSASNTPAQILSNNAVVGSFSSTGLAVTGTLSNTTGANFATASGNVGIGTTAPGSRLDISFGGYTGSGDALRIGADIGNNTTRTNATAKLGMVSLPHYTNAEEPFGLFYGYSTATTNELSFGSAVSAYNAATDIYFSTAANNTTVVGTERMRINSSGNVGIGAAPTAVTGFGINKFLELAGASVPGLVFRPTGSTCEHSILGAGDGLIFGATGAAIASNNVMRFFTSNTNSSNTPTERVRIDSSGNVGIGTTSLAGLKLVALGASGYPATTGVTQTGVLRLTGGTGLYNVLDMGVNESTDTAWMQATRANSLGTYDKLAINPYGGNVGIGTTSPARRLESRSTGGLQLRAAYDTLNYIDIGHMSASTGGVINSVGDATVNRFLAIQLDGSEKMRIDSGGNLGIGTTSPSTYVGASGQLVVYGGVGTTFTNNPQNITLVNNGTIAAGLGTGILFSANYNNSSTTTYAIISGIRENATSGSAAGVLVFGTRDSGGSVTTERMRIDSSGNLIISAAGSGTLGRLTVRKDTGIPLAVANEGATGTLIDFQGNGSGSRGSITHNGSSIAYNTTSDYRLKENVQPMTGALATVTALKPVTFNWKSNGSDGQGFIAHELQAVVPDCVTGEKDATEMQTYEISPAIPATKDEEGNELTAAIEAVMGEREVPRYQGIDTSFLVATLTAAIQELKAIVDAQATRITALEAK